MTIGVEQVRSFVEGISLDEGPLVIDEIAKAGPGGHFLDSDLTLERFRGTYFSSDIFPQLTLEEWQERDCPKADELLRQYTIRIIEDSTGPDDYEHLMQRGEAFINRLSV